MTLGQENPQQKTKQQASSSQTASVPAASQPSPYAGLGASSITALVQSNLVPTTSANIASQTTQTNMGATGAGAQYAYIYNPSTGQFTANPSKAMPGGTQLPTSTTTISSGEGSSTTSVTAQLPGSTSINGITSPGANVPSNAVKATQANSNITYVSPSGEVYYYYAAPSTLPAPAVSVKTSGPTTSYSLPAGYSFQTTGTGKDVIVDANGNIVGSSDFAVQNANVAKGLLPPFSTSAAQAAGFKVSADAQDNTILTNNLGQQFNIYGNPLKSPPTNLPIPLANLANLPTYASFAQQASSPANLTWNTTDPTAFTISMNLNGVNWNFSGNIPPQDAQSWIDSNGKLVYSQSAKNDAVDQAWSALYSTYQGGGSPTSGSTISFNTNTGTGTISSAASLPSSLNPSQLNSLYLSAMNYKQYAPTGTVLTIGGQTFTKNALQQIDTQLTSSEIQIDPTVSASYSDVLNGIITEGAYITTSGLYTYSVTQDPSTSAFVINKQLNPNATLAPGESVKIADNVYAANNTKIPLYLSDPQIVAYETVSLSGYSETSPKGGLEFENPQPYPVTRGIPITLFPNDATSAQPSSTVSAGQATLQTPPVSMAGLDITKTGIRTQSPPLHLLGKTIPLQALKDIGTALWNYGPELGRT